MPNEAHGDVGVPEWRDSATLKWMVETPRRQDPKFKVRERRLWETDNGRRPPLQGWRQLSPWGGALTR
jgi:hypothetical protein